jgi:DNA polymerase/3'-5' exonuclease PolX
MAALDAAAVAALLVELGRRTALASDNYFRAKAYLRAADTLSALVEPLDRVIAENRLRQLPGIGETIADIVTKLHNTGTHPLPHGGPHFGVAEPSPIQDFGKLRRGWRPVLFLIARFHPAGQEQRGVAAGIFE